MNKRKGRNLIAHAGFLEDIILVEKENEEILIKLNKENENLIEKIEEFLIDIIPLIPDKRK